MVHNTCKTSCERGRAGVVLLAILALAGAALAVWRLAGETGTGSFVREDFERQVGAEVARAVQQIAPDSDSRVAVLVLSPHDRGPYAERLAALTGGLEKRGYSVGEYDALSGATRLYGDRDYEEDYSPSIDAALDKFSPAVLVVLTGGGFTHTRISPAMENFVRDDGRFVFVGQVFRTDSPVLSLIRDGVAVAVARNTGPLAARSPQTRTLDASSPDEYVRDYYTVLRSGNAAALAKPSR